MRIPVTRRALCVCVAIVSAWTAWILPAAATEVGEDFPIPSAGDQDWLNSLFYLPTAPRVRREYRMLSDEERRIFNDAIKQMKDDTSVHPNKFTLLTSIHGRRSSRNSAHKGPDFLGWHRVFVLLLENALREKVPDITLPYWDTTLEAALDVPRKSALFTEDFMGNGDGYINIGIFKDWTSQNGILHRTVGRIKAPMSDRNISQLLTKRHLEQISFPNGNPRDYTEIEDLHNHVHNWVGGEMDIIETAADDPIFFIYHAYVDFIYQMFRDNQRKYGIDPVTDYVEHYGQARHHMYSSMGLGNLLVIDSLSNVFEWNIVYDKQPVCSKLDTDCKSDHLWCNVTKGQCVPWTIEEYRDIKSDAEQQGTTLTSQANIYKVLKLNSLSEADGYHDDDNHHHSDEGYGDDRLHDSGDEFGDNYGEHYHEHHAHDERERLYEHYTPYSDTRLTAILMIVLYVGIGCLVAIAIIAKCSSIKRAEDANVSKLTGIVNISYTENLHTRFPERIYNAESFPTAGQTVTVEDGYARVHIDRIDEDMHAKHNILASTSKETRMVTSPITKATEHNLSAEDEQDNYRSGMLELHPIDNKEPTESARDEHHGNHVIANHMSEKEKTSNGGIDMLINTSNGNSHVGNNIERSSQFDDNNQNRNDNMPTIREERTSETTDQECKVSNKSEEQSNRENTLSITKNDFSATGEQRKVSNQNGQMNAVTDINAKINMTSAIKNDVITDDGTNNKDGFESNMNFGKQFYKQFS